jgi:glycosyltransferase involved in cell wall biosynthesis
MSETIIQTDSADRPAISVLMPVYNAAAFLHAAVGSILQQTFRDFELICIDDGSGDDSLAILREYQWADPRVRLYSRPNTGIVGALNDALDMARAPLCARMDADDRCDPRRFALQWTFMLEHPHLVAVGTALRCVDIYGSPLGAINPPLDHDAIDRRLMLGDASALVHATLMIRTEVLRRIGGWQNRFNWVEDLDLFLRLAEAGRVANLSEPLYDYVRHPDSVCYRNYEVMCQRVRDVMREAYARRGRLDELDFTKIRPELWENEKATSPAQMFRDWACHAIHAKNARVARKHALDALRREPWSPRSWKVMYWALAA